MIEVGKIYRDKGMKDKYLFVLYSSDGWFSGYYLGQTNVISWFSVKKNAAYFEEVT